MGVIGCFSSPGPSSVPNTGPPSRPVSAGAGQRDWLPGLAWAWPKCGGVCLVIIQPRLH
jgi:hypothetical protein